MARDLVSPDQTSKSPEPVSGRAIETQTTAEQAVLEVMLFQRSSRSSELVLELDAGRLSLVSASS